MRRRLPSYDDADEKDERSRYGPNYDTQVRTTRRRGDGAQVSVDLRGNYHHPSQPAVLYANGGAEYFWHGQPYRMDRFGPAAVVRRPSARWYHSTTVFSHPQLPLMWVMSTDDTDDNTWRVMVEPVRSAGYPVGTSDHILLGEAAWQVATAARRWPASCCSREAESTR
jgi:hypothetical protein